MTATSSRGWWPRLDEQSGVEDATLLICGWLGEQGVDTMLRVDAERMRAGQQSWTFAEGGRCLSRRVPWQGADCPARCWPARAVLTLGLNPVGARRPAGAWPRRWHNSSGTNRSTGSPTNHSTTHQHQKKRRLSRATPVPPLPRKYRP